MFSKTEDKIKNLDAAMQTRLGNDKRPTPPSILSSDMTLAGDIYSEGEVHVDCKMQGDIKCRSLVLGLNSEVEGTVAADSVKLHGKFKGQIIARNVVLASTSFVTGDITHETIEIEHGAYLEGHCHRSDDPIPAEQGPEDLMISDQTAGHKTSVSGKDIKDGKDAKDKADKDKSAKPDNLIKIG